jgi:hypothetical protein
MQIMLPIPRPLIWPRDVDRVGKEKHITVPQVAMVGVQIEERNS